MAYLAGQNDALMRMQQQQGSSVTVVGPVKHPVVPWSRNMTLARALVQAGYIGTAQPTGITIRRGDEEIHVDMDRFLEGEDSLLREGDVVELQE